MGLLGLYNVGRWSLGRALKEFWKGLRARMHWVPWVMEEGDKVETFSVVKRGFRKREERVPSAAGPLSCRPITLGLWSVLISSLSPSPGGVYQPVEEVLGKKNLGATV